MDILKISLSGSVIILIILALRAALLGKLPKRIFAILWFIAVLALLLPFPFKTPVSLKNLSFGDTTQNSSAPHSEGVENTVQFIGEHKNTERYAAVEEDISAGANIPLIIWGAGSSGLACIIAVKHIRTLKLFKMSLPYENAYVKERLNSYRLRRGVEVRVSDAINSPLTYGILKPVILIPKSLSCEDNEALECILAHEFVHIKHFDNLYKLVLLTAAVVHWFNPLVWIMCAFASRDLELACDEAVLNMRGIKTKKTYALLLIGLEEKRVQLNAALSRFGAASIKERIKNIMKIKKKTVAAIVASGLIIGGLSTAYAAVSPAADRDFITITSVEENGGDYVLDLTQYDEYAPFGIEYDEEKDAFYYNGEPVMLFEDGVELEPGMAASKCSYYDPKGTAAIKTVRTPEKNADGSTNPFGKITGIEELSQKEIDELIDIHTDKGTAQYTYVMEDDAIETDEPNASEYQTAYSEVTVADEFASEDILAEAELAEKYTALGLVYDYDKSGDKFKMSFKGKDVHALFDEVEGVWIANNMHGYDLDNAVDLEAVYKNGELTALDAVPCTHQGQTYFLEGGDAVYTYSINEAAEADEASVLTDNVIEQTTAFSGSAVAAEEGTPLPEMFGKYKKYGIEYKESTDKNGDQIRNLYYKGKLVNSFADVNPNGSVFTFGSSEQSGSGVNVQTVYKDGKLAGVEEI